MIGTNGGILVSNAHPVSPFEHQHGLFHRMLMQRRCGTRLDRVDEETDPSGAEIFVGQKLTANPGTHEYFGKSLMIDNGHMSLLDVHIRIQNDVSQVLSGLAPRDSSRSM